MNPILRMSSVWLSLLLIGLAASPGVPAAEAPSVGPLEGEPFGHTLSAQDQHGEEQSLDTLMGEQGLVVAFVRSVDWCPFCRAQLAEINDRLAEFEALGLNVAAVTVDEVPEIHAFVEEHAIEYSILADPAGAINAALDIRDPEYPVGSAAFGVPRPVLYVVDPDGTVRARYMEPTFRTRPDLDTVLSEAALAP
jgi:peroxiredoxin